MKKKQKHFKLQNRFLPFLLMLAMLITKPTITHAQKDTTDKKLLKYELSIDLVPIIDNGTFGKVLFKIRNKGNSGYKGAYRFGIQGSYNGYRAPDLDHQDETNGDLTLTFGYEKYKPLSKLYFYYGADFAAKAYFTKFTDPEKDELRGYVFVLNPFVGIKYMFHKRLSVSFESAWENGIGFAKDTRKPEMQIDHYYSFSSHIRIPYCFSINYQF